MCNLSSTSHSSLEKDNSLNHSYVSPKMGCLEYKYITNTPFTLALLIRSETGFAPMRAFTLHQLIRISDFNRIKLNHLLEVVSHRFSLLRVLTA